MNPLISIIIPCYNHGQYILETIKSVELNNQKYPFEIIIINDGSTDIYTKNVLNELEAKSYIIINQNNLGLSTARNNGIKASKGNFIIPIDADDRIIPQNIENGIEFLIKNNNIGIVYGDSLHFGDENRIFKPGFFSLKKLLIENYISSCIIMRKSVWLDCNGYDSNLTSYEDWEFNIQAASNGWKFHYIPQIMFEYRILKNSMLRTHPKLNECINYIAKKHGLLYRTEFLKTITISQRIKSSLYDFYKKLIGKPNY